MLKRTLLGLMLFVGLSRGVPAETRTYVVPETDGAAFRISLEAAAGDLVARQNGLVLLSNGREIHASGEPGLLDLFGERLKRIDARIAQAPGDAGPIPPPRDGQPPARRPARDAVPEADRVREVNRLVGELQGIIDKQNKIRDEALKAARTPVADRVNQVYRVHGPVADLANTLRGMFVDSSIVTEPLGNSLLVSATQADAPIIEALLRQLDVVPARVRVSVLVAELSGATEAWEPKGTWNEASRELEALAAKGAGSILRRIQLSTLSNQIASAQMGESVNVQTGRTFSPRGETPTYQTNQIGTMLTCTPRVDPDGQVTMELAFEMSRLAPPAPKAAAPPASTDASGGASASSLGGPQRQSAIVRTTVSIPKGKAVSISDFATQDAGAPARLILVVGCQVE